ncbi:MAG TPA: VWA domain-containing protein [Chloroflexia bacterium]|nr:VWA domain-containing protein [Chloroflexia bacterium]
MKLIAHLDRRLTSAGSATERYLRVQIEAPDHKGPTTRLPLNIALVIDRSGSMEGTKLEKAKEAAIFCLRNLTGADRAAVIAYDDEVRVVSPSRALTPEVKNQLISEIRSIRSGGSTNLAGGWLTGAQEVANHQHEANFLNRVILLSDGLANVGVIDPGELAHHASELRQRGVSTTTMGIGADFNEDLMEQIAIKGGGHFYFIENAKQIPDFLHRELGEVLSTSARRVALEVGLPAAIEARLLNSFEVDRAGPGLRVRLDDMIAGESRSLVFKLTVQPGATGATLPIRLALSYTDVETGESRAAHSSEATLTYASDADVAAEAPNSSVLEDAALLEAALAREAALRYDAEGNYAQSSASLSLAADYLLAVAPASPVASAEAMTLKEESAAATQGFGAFQRKALHYAKSARQQSRKK